MGLFEALAANDEAKRVASRKAYALADKRIRDRFGDFLKASKNVDEFDARLSHVAEDIKTTVLTTWEEQGRLEGTGVSAATIMTATIENLREAALGCPCQGQCVCGKSRTAGVEDFINQQYIPEKREEINGTPENPGGACPQCGHPQPCPLHGARQARTARRPKMCPYHREVLDISLGTGDPQAGFNSMSQQAFTDHSCRGGFQGTCNFKPEMVTKDFWDQKAEQAEQKRRERQEQQAIEQVPQAPEFEAPQLVDEAPAAPEEGTLTDQLSEAPSAVGAPAEPMAMAARVAATVPQPLVHGGTIAPLRQIAQRKPGLTINGLPYEQWEQEANDRIMQGARPDEFEPVEVGHPKPAWEQVAADILNVGHEGPLRQYLADLKARKQQQQPPPDQAGPALASAKTAEALKTIDVDAGDGPEPKIDKRKWTPQNVVKRIEDAEMDGSPHPTVEQDIIEPPDYRGDAFSDDGRFEQTDAVTEKQDVTKGTESGQVPSVVKDNNGWSNSNGANPVTRETP